MAFSFGTNGWTEFTRIYLLAALLLMVFAFAFATAEAVGYVECGIEFYASAR